MPEGSCKRESSPLEIESPPWPLGTPTPVVVDGILLPELNAIFLEWPVFEVNGYEGVLLDGRAGLFALVLPA